MRNIIIFALLLAGCERRVEDKADNIMGGSPPLFNPKNSAATVSRERYKRLDPHAEVISNGQ